MRPLMLQIANQRVVTWCRAVCIQIAAESDLQHA